MAFSIQLIFIKTNSVIFTDKMNYICKFGRQIFYYRFFHANCNANPITQATYTKYTEMMRERDGDAIVTSEEREGAWIDLSKNVFLRESMSFEERKMKAIQRMKKRQAE